MISLSTERLRHLLETIISCITRHTNPEIDLGEHKFILRVDPRDQGRVVGKQGQAIWAIQTIFWYAGYTQAMHPWGIKLLEPEAPCKGLSSPFKFTAKWDREKIQKMLATIQEVCLPLHSSFRLEETDDTSATVFFQIDAYLQTPMLEPNFAEAVRIIVRAAGMVQGVSLKTEIIFK